MDRQRAGGVVLFLACAVLLTVSVLSRGDIKGVASAEPGRPVPAVGSCLTRAQPGPGSDNPALVLGNCETGKFGEVYAVIDPALAPMGSPDSCGRELASAYLGVTAELPGWTPSLQMGLSVAVPDRKQLAAGQNWLACVVGPLITDVPYQGTVRDSLAGGDIPDAFGQCSSTSQSRFPRPLACATPHNTETFARLSITGPGPGMESLQASCSELISVHTGMADITAAGALIAETVYFKHDTKGSRRVPSPLSPGVQAEAYCLLSVVGTRTLNASLLGVGSGSLPWV